MEADQIDKDFRNGFLLLLPFIIIVAILSGTIFSFVGAMIANIVYLVVCGSLFIMFQRGENNILRNKGILIVVMFIVYSSVMWCSVYINTRGGQNG